MVAYSFKQQFEEPIAALQKRQTVRGNRNRHARPGEPMQLYVAMRTRHCRKILTPDPICLDVRKIEIALDRNTARLIKKMEIEGIRLSDEEMEAFAIADGFGGEFGSPLYRMGKFWSVNHQTDYIEGVVIRWEPQV